MSSFRRYPRHPEPPVTRSRPVAGLVHLVLALAGWVLFGAFWLQVFYRTPPAESAFGVILVAVLLVLSVSLTVAWIRHNLILSRKYEGRRTRPRPVSPDWSRDKLGRPVVGPGWDVLKGSARVEIALDPRTGQKIYRAG